MEKKEIAFADVKRSLNRLEGFIDDLLLNVQSFNERDIEDVWTQLSYWLNEVKNNREGDDSINYIGIYDCVDFILNNSSIVLAKMAFSIDAKIKEIESIVLTYISYQVTQKVASSLLWETGSILSQIGELYIEPFIQKTKNNYTIPNSETGDNGCLNTGDNSEDEDSGDEVPDDEGNEIILPIAMDTEKAKVLFTAAYNEEWITGDNESGFKWIGFGNISKRTGRVVSCTNKLAYLCHIIYEPYAPDWVEIESFFGEKRLDRDWTNIKDSINATFRPTWMNTIDNLIRKKGY